MYRPWLTPGSTCYALRLFRFRTRSGYASRTSAFSRRCRISHRHTNEFKDILDCLDAFTLKKSAIQAAGGGLSPISKEIDAFLQARGWQPRKFDTKIVVDQTEFPSPTHKVDNFKLGTGLKTGIGLEVEWNNKTEFYDRDLSNFRLLRNLHVLSVGVIITRMSELQRLFNELKKGKSFGPTTTHWGKLIPKVDGGGAGGCPLLLVGIGLACYRADL